MLPLQIGSIQIAAVAAFPPPLPAGQRVRAGGHSVEALTAPYRSGLSRDWIKVKNPESPAMLRHREGRW